LLFILGADWVGWRLFEHCLRLSSSIRWPATAIGLSSLRARPATRGDTIHFLAARVVIGCHHLFSPARIIDSVNTKAAESDLAKAIHSMIRVLDEARSVDFYNKAFSLEVAQRLDFETFTLIYLSNANSPFEVELTVNKGRTEPYAPGDGYGHLAVSVADLDSEHDRIGALGLNPKKIVEFNHDGALIARFFFIEDPDGYKIEVLQRGGRFQ